MCRGLADDVEVMGVRVWTDQSLLEDAQDEQVGHGQVLGGADDPAELGCADGALCGFPAQVSGSSQDAIQAGPRGERATYG